MRPPACTKSCPQIKDDIRLRLPISSFLRFGPVFSHNLLNICCKVGESYTVYCVHCHWNFKIMLLSYSQTLFWRRKKPFFVINHFTFFFKSVFLVLLYYLYRPSDHTVGRPRTDIRTRTGRPRGRDSTPRPPHLLINIYRFYFIDELFIHGMVFILCVLHEPITVQGR